MKAFRIFGRPLFFPMKHLSYLLVLGLLAPLAACKKEKGCRDEAALNYNPDAKRDGEACIYERNKFFGSYQAEFSCKTEAFYFDESFTIAAGTDNTNQIVLRNFPQSGANTNAHLTSNAQGFTIPAQQFVVELDTTVISGSGLLSSGSLSIEIIREYQGILDTCTTTAIRVTEE